MEDFWMAHRYCDKNFTLESHYENVYQIIVVLCGRIRYRVGKKEYIVSKGGMIVLNTLEDHTLEVLEIIQNRIGKIAKKCESSKDKKDLFELETLRKCEEALLQNKSLRTIDLNEDELLLLKSFCLITLKPILF